MKKFYFYIVFLLSISILCSSCAKQQTSISKTGFFFDTYITITLYDESQQAYLDHCLELCEYYQNLFDKNTESSDIYRINHAAGDTVSVESDTLEIITESIDYAKKSQGRFDITIGALSEVWNITSQTPSVPSVNEITFALNTVNYQEIAIDSHNSTICLKNPDAHLDLGAVAKGYIADKLKEYLLSEGISHGLINLGGNILLINDKPEHSNYQIGIQKPFGKMGETIVTVSATDKSIVTSGVYQRYFYENDKLYHHILDTTTGYPVETDLLGVTIISDSSTDGDCYSTICLSLGLDAGLEFVEQLENIEAIFISEDHEIHLSSGLKISDNIVTIQ